MASFIKHPRNSSPESVGADTQHSPIAAGPAFFDGPAGVSGARQPFRRALWTHACPSTPACSAPRGAAASKPGGWLLTLLGRGVTAAPTPRDERVGAIATATQLLLERRHPQLLAMIAQQRGIMASSCARVAADRSKALSLAMDKNVRTPIL